MKPNRDFNILVEALLIENPHVRIADDDEDLHLEDILGDKEALKNLLRRKIHAHPHRRLEVFKQLRTAPGLLLMVRKYFDMKLTDFIEMLKDILKETMGHSASLTH